jgi:hypothetical protein
MIAGRTLTAHRRIARSILRATPRENPRQRIVQRLRHFSMLAFLALGGCGGGPSVGDIKAALEEYYSSHAILEEIKDVNCKEAVGAPGFVCTYDAVIADRRIPSLRNHVPDARFVQRNSKWVLAAFVQ